MCPDNFQKLILSIEMLMLRIMMTTNLVFPDQVVNQLDQQDNQRVDIRVQQRNGKKCLTLVEGLSHELDLKRILSTMKKKFSTNGTLLKKDKDSSSQILQLQGDKRQDVCNFLVEHQ